MEGSWKEHNGFRVRAGLLLRYVCDMLETWLGDVLTKGDGKSDTSAEHYSPGFLA
jgi:hypothetical protein